MEKPIKELISEIILELAMPDANDTPILKVWAMEGMGEIGNSRLQAFETDWMLVDDLQVCKPKNMSAPIKVILSIDKQHCVEPYIDPKLIRCGCCDNCHSTCEITMGENQTHFYFSSNALSHNTCKIQYIGLPCDENGEPLIDDSCKRAVKQYVNYRVTVRDRKRDRNKVPMSEVDYERQQWVILKNQAAGRINMPTLLEMPSIVSQFYNAGITVDMIVNRYNGYWGAYNQNS
jgi:hypothetical protein